MENKINIAELLKDCPKGMELYSPIFGEVYFKRIKNTERVTLIEVATSCNSIYLFYPDGKYNTYYSNSECLLFPSKDQRDWNKFQRPFKDGDIVANDTGWIGITSGGKINSFIPTYCVIKPNGEFEAYFDKKGTWQFSRLATGEEMQKLFDAIKSRGYCWNAETKTLEKLVIPKFDISTLKPFDKVLARQNVSGKWSIDFFGGYAEGFYYTTGSSMYVQCIPYNDDTKHLLGKTDDCDDFYKTWK